MTPPVTLLAWRGRAASCVPQLPACFRGGGDSGLVRKSARKRLFSTQNNTRERRQLSTVRGARDRATPVRGSRDGSTRRDGHVVGTARARPRACRARAGAALSPYALAADRVRLPPSAHLL